jgi:cob(I)alamin adenosyltransferase
MGISTKRGDNGFSETCGGRRLPKDHAVFEALGTLDELGSCLGLVKAVLRKESLDGSGKSSRPLVDQLEEIQRDLIRIGHEVAAGTAAARSKGPPRIGEAELVRLEGWTSELEAAVVPRRDFVLPGQTVASAWADLARTVCRRLERRYAGFRRAEEEPKRERDARGKAEARPAAERSRQPGADRESTAPAYLNRLSDYLFLVARAWEAGSYRG